MHEDNEGHSPAAWTGVTISLVAAAVACYAAVFGPVELMWGGIVVFLLGGVVWYAMDKAGMGGSESSRSES